MGLELKEPLSLSMRSTPRSRLSSHIQDSFEVTAAFWLAESALFILLADMLSLISNPRLKKLVVLFLPDPPSQCKASFDGRGTGSQTFHILSFYVGFFSLLPKFWAVPPFPLSFRLPPSLVRSFYLITNCSNLIPYENIQNSLYFSGIFSPRSPPLIKNTAIISYKRCRY